LLGGPGGIGSIGFEPRAARFRFGAFLQRFGERETGGVGAVEAGGALAYRSGGEKGGRAYQEQGAVHGAYPAR
ncbi:MAG: hypothetical protein WBA68_00645, partial [Alteraurantiacibacter sp.]